ncbi:MAG: glycosyltransferase family 9 protein [Candidatus Methylacidiphilales bacterium]|nr:glycosyltransferase family 9 protein [Candidatus Methylacidiphilales bacterium]
MKWFNALHAGTYRTLFGLAARIKPPKSQLICLGPQSRVLVFTCAGIGDTLTDSVVLKALAETWPGIKIGAVVHTRRRSLLEHNPFCWKVYPFQKGPLAFFRLSRRLQADGPWDAILHLRGNDPEPRCLSFLLNPGVTVSVPQMTRLGHLCAHTVVQHDWDDTHGVEQTLRIARYVGADTDRPHLVYQVRDSEKTELHTKLQKLGVESSATPGAPDVARKPILVLQIGGGRRASWRDWPVEHYAALIHLAAPLGAEIILLGGKDNANRAMAIEQLCHTPEVQRELARGGSRVHNLAGAISLSLSAALLVESRAVVSTDTGIMHLAFAVGARVVALIHCNNPAHRVGPWGYGDRHRVVQLPRPAGYHSPADATMLDLRPTTVYQNLLEIW